ncbi:MAG: enoyl-CoA hydratase/isomerase family protein [Desulfobacterales bacterium]|nr:enoyl-CoA hydratase/isomerase family protein [Desulfobacterales bacterium]
MDYALKLFESDNKIKVILLRSKCSASKKYNKIFSVGTNLKEYDKKFQLIESNPAEFEKIIKLNRSLLSKVETLKKPVIAGVDGLAVGGAFELILACDLIFASDEAKFALSEINIGLIPGYGGIQRLIRSIGKKKLLKLFQPEGYSQLKKPLLWELSLKFAQIHCLKIKLWNIANN